jgi:fluoroquinolone transport system permease protein
MKMYINSFKIFLRELWNDKMLIMVLFAPFLAGVAFKFGIPFLEKFLTETFNKDMIIAPYYLLFDLFLSVMVPYLICFVSALVMLTETDENVSIYMAVTPLSKGGYLISRLVVPAIISYPVTMIILALFSLTNQGILFYLIAPFLNCLLSVIVALLITAVSTNKVEGLALGKGAGIIMLGLPVPFFISSSARYLFVFLPSFWTAEFALSGNILPVLPALLLSMGMIWLLSKKFIKKLF